MTYRVDVLACDVYIPSDKVLLAQDAADTVAHTNHGDLVRSLREECLGAVRLPGGGVRFQEIDWDCEGDFHISTADALLHALAPYVADGSYLVFVSEDFEVWRCYFCGGEYQRDCSDWLTRGLGPVIGEADAA